MPKCEGCEERSKKSGGRPRESKQKVAATPATAAASTVPTTVSSTTSQKSARQPKRESVRETLKVGFMLITERSRKKTPPNSLVQIH